MATLQISRLLLLGAAVWLAGCGVLEKSWLVPEVNSTVPFETVLLNKQVLDAVALAVRDVDALSWSKEITYLDVLEGTLETGYFRKPNVAAMQLRAQIDRENKVIALTVKGAGPYYSKLPIDQGHQLIRAALAHRLAEAVHGRQVQRSTPLSQW